MANTGKTFTDYAANSASLANSIANGDLFIISTNVSGNAVTKVINANTLFQTTKVLVIPVGNTPANSTSMTVQAGLTWQDGSYIYLATSNNNVKRLGPFSTF